jgi:hypothetical protein
MTRLQVLKEYFGIRPTQSIRDFSNELKALSEEEKTELATLAAIELNVALDAEKK